MRVDDRYSCVWRGGEDPGCREEVDAVSTLHLADVTGTAALLSGCVWEPSRDGLLQPTSHDKFRDGLGKKHNSSVRFDCFTYYRPNPNTLKWVYGSTLLSHYYLFQIIHPEHSRPINV